MNIYVAHINAGVVAQVTVEPDDFEPGPDQAVIGPDNTVGIGWTFEGGAFVPPFTPE